MDNPKFSIVLPVLGKQEELESFLEPFHQFTQDDSWELLVVDDHSPTPLMVENDTWQLIRTQKRSGAARCRNLGAERARGEFIIFLSHFLAIPHDYLPRIEAFISRTKFDFAQHPVVLAPGLETDHFQAFIGDQNRRVSTNKNLAIKQSLFAAALVRRSVFEDLDGFDPQMQHYGGHEMDLIHRLDKAGYGRRRTIDTIPLERTMISDHETVRTRLREYGGIGLPNLLTKHPELKKYILPLNVPWKVTWVLGITRLLETLLSSRINRNIKLPHMAYRLYLHLVVRNAWESR